MQAILMETGLAGALLRRAESNGSTAPITGSRLKDLLDLVASIEQGLRAFGRRNRSLREFLGMAFTPAAPDPEQPDSPADPRDGLLPLYLIEHNGKEEPFYSEKERRDYLSAHKLHVGVETEKESAAQAAITPEADGGAEAQETPATESQRVREIELHEVKVLNKHLVRLRDEYDLRAEVLLPREVTGDDPPPLHSRTRRRDLSSSGSQGADFHGAQDRRKRDENHALQGARGNGCRTALGDHHGPDAPYLDAGSA